MQQLISRIVPNTEYSRKNGWVSPDIINDIRALLKKQAVLLLDRQGFDTDSVHASAFCISVMTELMSLNGFIYWLA